MGQAFLTCLRVASRSTPLSLQAKLSTLTIIIPPEGTRSKVAHWKTGFYYIAQGAGIPIALGYLDFKRKVAGTNRLFIPTGNLEADMAEIQGFYANITGKNPRQF